MKPGDLFITFDSNSNETVIVASQVSEVDSKHGPKGELVRAVSLKSTTYPIFDHPASLRLIFESHSIFTKAQRQERTSIFTAAEILSLSLQYRSVIRSTHDSLDESEVDFRKTLSSFDLIWSLFEAIFLKPQDSSIVVDLVLWARLCLVRTPFLVEITEALSSNRIADIRKDDLWEQVLLLVLCGMFTNAKNLLETYNDATPGAECAEIIRILDDINIELLNDPNTQGDFIEFQRNVRARIATGVFRSNEYPGLVANVIAGELNSILHAGQLLDNWYELMPAFLLFLRPTTTLAHLHEAVEDCINIHGSNSEGYLDDVMRALFSLDALKVLQLVSSGDWWLAAHLSDLLANSDSRTTNAYGVDIRQHLIIEYASSLFAKRGLWQIGFDYMRSCGDEGMNMLQLLVPSLYIDNDMMALKLVKLCTEIGLDDINVIISRQLAYNYLRFGCWGSALSWAIRSLDSEIATYVADQILLRCPPKAISKLLLLEYLSDSILLSPSLAFLHKYFNFRNCLEQGEQDSSATLLVDLITSNLAPRKFHCVLFDDLMSILNNKGKVLIGKDETYRVLQYLKSYSVEEDVWLNENSIHSDDDEKTRLDDLLFALFTNLANATTSH